MLLRTVWTTTSLLALLLGSLPAVAAAEEDTRLKVSADARFRLEADWDSQRPDGVEREDRTRARLRFRLGLEYAMTPSLSVGLRLRTGSADSQQSPHITVEDFDGNDNGDQDILPDRIFLRYRGDKGWVWAGRNAFPFWKPSEFFWDDDVHPVGVAAGTRVSAGRSEVAFNAALLALPDGGYDLTGRLAAGQVVISRSAARIPWTAAAGFYRFEGEQGARLLRSGNGARDDSIAVVALRAVPKLAGHPLSLSLEWMHNFEDYRRDDPDPFTAANFDQTDGVAFSLGWREAKAPGQWRLGYAYARVEALAVHASYAQDDWVRWGSATQTDASDYRGHELLFAVALPRKIELVARVFLAESLTSPQDGKRARLDLNYKF